MSHEVRPDGNGAALDALRGPFLPIENAPVLARGGHKRFFAGIGDYVEPFARHIEPGAGRPPAPLMPVEHYLPPTPGAPGAPGVIPANDALVQVVLRALEIVRAREEGLPTKEVRFSTGTAETFAVGVVPVQLDQVIRRERRALMLTNTHAINFVWYGFSGTVRVGNGGFLAPGGGTASLPIDENVQVWAIATAAATPVSLLQFA